MLAVHASEYANVKRPTDPLTKKPIEPAHRFEVSLESDAFSVEKSVLRLAITKPNISLTITNRWNVFLAYQMTVHKEPKSRWSHQSFTRFLCSGLNRKVIRTNDKSQKLGSYHQCYRLDGKLIAVGVLDLLPHAVSSVYLL
jgi:arginine-tRNA-protein transferase